MAVFRSHIPVTSVRRQGYLTRLDALDFLADVRSGIADILFLDPPFNLKKDYGIRSAIEDSDPGTYEVYLSEIINEAVRIIRPGGALFLYHMPIWASRLAIYLNEKLEFRHWIAVSMKNGFVRGRRLYPAHYALLYFTKGMPRTFKRPRLRPTRCRHCDEFIKDYGGYRRIIERRGVNLSDYWDDISPVRHAHSKLRAANQLPLRLTDRVVAIAGRRNGLLIDPFAGSGTALVSAAAAGMHFIGNDLASANLRICQSRLATLGEPQIDR